jgi:hypothetical protein
MKGNTHMKQIIVIIGSVVLGVLIVGMMIGIGGNQDGTLAGAAGDVVGQGIVQMEGMLP